MHETGPGHQLCWVRGHVLQSGQWDSISLWCGLGAGSSLALSPLHIATDL